MNASTNGVRYRGVDRRAALPVAETLGIPHTAAGLGAVCVVAIVCSSVLDATATRTLARVAAAAGALAVVGGVAMFVRWRIDGRAQSWWLAVGYTLVGSSGLVDSRAGGAQEALYLGALAVALGFFVAAARTPEVDSFLTVRRAVAGLVGGLAVAATLQWLLAPQPDVMRPVAGAIAALYVCLGVVWCRTEQDKPWFVIPILGFASTGLLLAAVPNVARGLAGAACVQLFVNAIVAATALGGVQASATGQRALALDAQRERDLVNSLREELEARYAETLHEIRSAALALEGGMHVFEQPAGRDDGTDRLSRSIIAELHRLREIANPDNASAPTTFRLAEALEPLVALSDASGWRVRWDFGDDVWTRGRPTDVRQIVHGLLANAHKYAPGGVIEVSVRRAARFVLVMVDDEGPGVRPAHRERIFERGARADQEHSGDGHGLGLHIGRQIARSLGGELWVEQQPRGGARFVLALRAGPAEHVGEPIERCAS